MSYAYKLRRTAPWLWLAPAIAIFIPFFIIPIAVVVRNSFNVDDPLALMVSDFTLINYRNVITDPYYYRVIFNSLWVSAAITIGTLLIGYPFAYFLVRRAGRSLIFLLWAIYTPLVVSIIVRAFGWIVITADSGLINAALLSVGLVNEPVKILFEVEGMMVAMVHRYLPLMVIPLVNALSRIDTQLYSASLNLGASDRRTFWKITVPLSLPGFVAGTQLVFAVVLSDFVIPSLLGSTRFRMLAPVVYDEAMIRVAWANAAALASVMLLIVVTMLVTSTLTYRRLAPWARGL